MALLPSSSHEIGSSAAERIYDIVVFGATGFLGKLATAALVGLRDPYLTIPPDALVATSGRAKIALAARNPTKLDALVAEYKAAGAFMDDVDLIIADYDDPSSLDAFVTKTKVVLFTAAASMNFPHKLTPDTLVMKCAKAGTHFVDNSLSWLPYYTFEPFDGTLGITLATIDAAARATGAVVMPGAGCANTPHEVSTYAAYKVLKAPLKKATSYTLSYGPGCKVDMISEGADLYPINFFGMPLDPNIVKLGDVPMQKSVMEYIIKPMMLISGRQSGWGANFTYEEFAPNNPCAMREEWHDHSPTFRKQARVTVITEVEAEDGRTRTVTWRMGEGFYEDTVRPAVEMALGLIFEADEVPALKTGGVWMGIPGWEEVLLNNLGKIGISTTVEEPGASTAALVAAELTKFGLWPPTQQEA